MKKLKINCPEGHIIDMDKSNLEAGEIYFKPVKREHVNSWEELKVIHGAYVGTSCKVHNCSSTKYNTSLENRNIFKTVKQAESVNPFAMLSQLIDQYESSKDVDWGNNNQVKYCIRRQGNKVVKVSSHAIYCFLAFTSRKECDKFHEKHLKLIEKYYML